MGCSAVALESADDVGGTWYWNRYPGARCDIMTVDYSYSWDPDLETEWQWSEKYATQPEILRYLRHVADKHDLRRDIRFSTRVERATWDQSAECWTIATSDGDEIRCRYFVMASGCLSVPKVAGRRRRGSVSWRGLLHLPLAASGRGLHGQARGGDRDGILGRAVHPADRRAGGGADRLSADPQLQPAGEERTGAVGEGRGLPARSCRLPGVGAMDPPRCPDRAAREGCVAGIGTGAPRELRGHVGVGRSASAVLPGSPAERGGQRDTVRIPARQDPVDREGPCHGRGALPEGPLLRHQAARASTPATTRPSTCRTCGWWISARPPSPPSRRTGSRRPPPR